MLFWIECAQPVDSAAFQFVIFFSPQAKSWRKKKSRTISKCEESQQIKLNEEDDD